MKELLKIIDCKYIISEIEKSRKEAAMTVSFICLCCASIDYILRKQGIIEDWFTQSYLIIGFFSICVWSVKTFNKIADRVDARKLFIKKYNNAKPFLSYMSEKEEYILKKFVDDNSCMTTFDNEYLKKIYYDADVINTIYLRFKPLNFTIIQCASKPILALKINQEFFEVLKEYFKDKI